MNLFKTVVVPIGIFFLVEFIDLIIYEIVKHFCHLADHWKILRDGMTLAIFLFYIFQKQILNYRDFNLYANYLIPIALVLFVVLKFYPNSKSFKLNPSLIFQGLIFSPIIEEIICRKVILENLADDGYLILGIAISLVIFVILHFEKTFLGNFFFILAGILLTWVQLRTKSLINVVLIHSFINLISILISCDIIKAIKLGDRF